ncbi:MAG: AAA family ATPase [Bacteroidia bacterium]
MYIHKVHIQNIRSFSDFTIEFSRGEEAGWHVLVGDNGSGKSSLLRAISLGLIGPLDAKFLRLSLRDWIKNGASKGSISMEIIDPERQNGLTMLQASGEIFSQNGKSAVFEITKDSENNFWNLSPSFFTAAFGPMRRFTGGDSDFQDSFDVAPRAAAHLSIFGENIALTQALIWLKELDHRRLKEKEESKDQQIKEGTEDYRTRAEIIFEEFKNFLNKSDLLPHHTYFQKIDINGQPVFVDGNQNSVKVSEMSDGYRSVLSMIFELIRQMLDMYGYEKVFKQFKQGNTFIDIPGVILIDEVDAHLHPTWQTRIGQWFTRYFPNIQFIVTTHSPLICRGCIDENGKIKGSVWQLAAPASGKDNQRLTGTKLQRLIFGNILDAYSTDAFGGQIGRAKQSTDLLKEYAKLDKLYTYNQITEEQNQRRIQLQKIFSTDAISDL